MNTRTRNNAQLRAMVILSWAFWANMTSVSLGQMYAVQDLGAIGGSSSIGYDVNTSGQVVGQTTLEVAGPYIHAALFDDGITDLATAGEDQSIAYAINDAGTIVGTSFNLGDLTQRAVRWDSGGITVLGDFLARDINNQGVVVGASARVSANGEWFRRAVRHEAGAVTDLPSFGGEDNIAAAVNELGWIVGSARIGPGPTRRATLWLAGAISDLGTLGGTSSEAADINDAWQVVGYSDAASGAPHAFMYQLNATGTVVSRTDLGHLGSGYSYARAVNEQGHVVGTSSGHAFLWRDGTMTDLNDLIASSANWTLFDATAINDAGQITGYGRHLGLKHAFLLTPAGNGDFDGDGDVDLVDFGQFQICFTGPGGGPLTPTCAAADFDGDNDVDLADFGGFQLAFTGAL